MTKRIFSLLLLPLLFLSVAFGYAADGAIAAGSGSFDPCLLDDGTVPTPQSDWCLAKFKQDPAGLGDPTTARGYIGDVISTVINLTLIAGALGAFAMFVYGGFRYITAQDDAAKTKQARDTMQYAAVGLVIMSMTYLVMLFYNSIWPSK